MNRRCFLALAGIASVSREVTVKQPICADNLKEIMKAEEVPGYVPRAVAWANTNIFTGEWAVCDDDDPIYEDRLLNEFYGPGRAAIVKNSHEILVREYTHQVASLSAANAAKSKTCPKCFRSFIGTNYWYHSRAGVCSGDSTQSIEG